MQNLALQASTSLTDVEAVLFPTGIRAMIWDLDHCLAEKSNDYIKEVWVGGFGQDFGHSPEEAQRLNDIHFREVGCSATGFARAHGHPDPAAYANDIYERHGPATGKLFTERQPRNPRLIELMEMVKDMNIQQMLMTQAHHTHMNIIVEHLGIGHCLPHHLRWDRTKMPFSKKTDVPWKRAAHALDVDYPAILTPEDTPDNILWPHKLGMHTVQIGDRPRAAHAAFHFPTAPALLESFVTQYAA